MYKNLDLYKYPGCVPDKLKKITFNLQGDQKWSPFLYKKMHMQCDINICVNDILRMYKIMYIQV